ncbi:MAG: ABC transporter permease subunit [Kiritimatiellae bacterium]|nr:ABC transporter permease subunit [Kiritimatiellia bacterium]
MSHRVCQIKALAGLSVLELYRRKDLIVVFVLCAVILLPLMVFTPFGVSGASRYVNEMALLLVWLFSLVIGLGVSARLFPPEFESRTIYPMLSKPVARGTVLAGKYAGALAASVSALAVFYAAYGLLAGVRQGVWFPAVLVQAFALHIGFLAVVTALGLLGSLVLTPSANLTMMGLTVTGMLFFGQRLSALASAQAWPGRTVLTLLDWFGPHVEFFDLRQRVVHEWPPIGWDVCLAVLAYAAGYAALCLMVAAFAFRKKRF